jgi:xylan 1,4-beta-xylosidase
MKPQKVMKILGIYAVICLLHAPVAPGQNLQDKSATFKNPILPGFYPDPSICRVNEDYYLVTSTFEYFPGIPIFHSKDLVHWNQIGHVLDRPSQLELDSIRPSGGVYAPTIRYHKGTFYVINTLVGKKGNFVVTASNPAGPWSDPHWIENAPGIDPSLFFDDDGKAYYTGNVRPDSIPRDSKYRSIWLQEIDLTSMKLVGERSIILNEGALHGANNAEAPHLYKVREMYYLMIAEGGTGDNHAVTIFRSKNLSGPYEGNKKNPILTHRHLGIEYPIACTGHADMAETQNGEWWMVMLGVRPYGGFHYNLGRETFLASVVWQDGWPVVNPGHGKVLEESPVPNLPLWQVPSRPACDNFDREALDFSWNFLRTPREKFYSLASRPGFLQLRLRPEMISKWENPSFIGRRQQHINFSASTAMEFLPKNKNESAGLVLLQNSDFQFRFEVVRSGKDNVIRLTKRHGGKEETLAELPIVTKRVYMKVEAAGQDYNFFVASGAGEWKPLREHVDGRTLSRTNAGGFVGTYIGMYASSNGTVSNNVADFDWFQYKGE